MCVYIEMTDKIHTENGMEKLLIGMEDVSFFFFPLKEMIEKKSIKWALV